jgi:ribosome-associated protein
MTNLELAQKIATILDDKKAIDVRIKKVGDLTVLTEYFVICNGTSNTHIKSLADEVEFKLKQEGVTGHLEGKTSDWLLVDFGSVIAHIFLPAAREQFNLERLWADAEDIPIA